MRITILKKYRYIRAFGGQVCSDCGKKHPHPDGDFALCERTSDGEFVAVCKKCRALPAENLAYPVEIVTDKNLRNHFGMGNQWLPRKPSGKFFDGISGSPRRKERINFSSHILYATIERARRDGLI